VNHPVVEENKSSAAHSHAGEKPKKKKAAIYIVPNLITCMSLFFGLLAIKYSIDGRMTGEGVFFLYAAYSILAAAVCDTLDGSVARLTHSQSSFGVQLDSLCDVVSFGIVPAVVIYNFALYDLKRIGFCVAFIYVACGALRLARFNIQSSLGRANGHFTGIPIPMAAAPLAVCIMAHEELRTWTSATYSPWEMSFAAALTNPQVVSISLLIIMFLLALGMISTFEYRSHKSFRLPSKRPFRFFAGILIVMALFLNLQFVVSLAILLLIYCLHGPVLWLFTRKDRAEEEEEMFETESQD